MNKRLIVAALTTMGFFSSAGMSGSPDSLYTKPKQHNQQHDAERMAKKAQAKRDRRAAKRVGKS